MKLRLARKPRLSIEDIEREAAAEIERRVSMGKPPPEEWKGVAELDPGMFRSQTALIPPAEAAPSVEPATTGAGPGAAAGPAAEPEAAAKAPAKTRVAKTKATTAKTKATTAKTKATTAKTKATARRAK